MNQSLIWLDEWENQLSEGHIKDEEFLTKNTAESLRITLHSTIDLSLFLLDECGFNYVHSSKFNQDYNLLVLQLYRLLSVYSLIKPLKTGNCTLSEGTLEIIISITYIFKEYINLI